MKSILWGVFGAILLSPSALLAQGNSLQNDFRVGGETGLEWPAGGPKPVAEKKAKNASVAEKKATEITCTGETLFDAKAGTAIFVKEVKVVDPQFSLTADKLTAHLKKALKEPAAAAVSVVEGAVGAATPMPSPKPSPGAKTDSASGLERAIAEGHVVITQDRVDEKTGEVTHYVGRAGKAEYNATLGEMTLSGWPQIQQGFNNQVATEEGTVMVMDREGHLRTKGPSMTVIKTEPKTDLKKNP